MTVMNNDCCIVIPIYNTTPSYFENISILNVIDMYSNKYDIVFIHPKNFNTRSYKYYGINFIEYEMWDGNINSYNLMCLSTDFYEIFSNYNYILLSQTDSLILNDSLDYWISKNYDFIGSPETSNVLNKYNTSFTYYNYNGGFSLRKVEAFIKATKFLNERNISNTFYEDEIFSLISNDILHKCPIAEAKYFSVSHTVSNDIIPNYYDDKFDVSKVFGVYKFNINSKRFNINTKPEFFKYIKPKIFSKCFDILNKYFKDTSTKDCVIVIPIYNETPKFLEEISILNTLKMYNNKYDIYLIHSENLDISYYTKRFYELKFMSISKNIWDNSYTSYNEMCLNPQFYAMFSDYEYMCIIQTDAYVLKTNLDDWLNMDYDYIGGPSLITYKSGFWKDVKNTNIAEIVSEDKYYNYNGGLSLRKISKFFNICNLLSILYYYSDSEDIIFSTINVITESNILNLCSYEKAKTFSNDYNTDITDEEINNLFGCHNVNRIYESQSFEEILQKYATLYKKINKIFMRHLATL